MKNYTITVNGNVYEVSVEENTGASVPVPVAAPVAKAPVTKAAPASSKPVASAAAGSKKVNSPMPGKILAVKSSNGATVKRGDVLVILEAMKMENEIVAPEDGVVASIDVAVGQSVEAGEILATLN